MGNKEKDLNHSHNFINYLPESDDDVFDMDWQIEGMIDLDERKKVKQGVNLKKFAKLDRKYFRNYFSQLDKKTHFRSCCDGQKIDEIPSHVETLIKECPTFSYLLTEILCSRLCNYLGIDTVVNESCVDNENNYFLASLSFIRPNEEFVTLFDMITSKDEKLKENKLEKKFFCETVKNYCESNNIYVDEKQLDEFHERVLKSRFIREAVLGDSDFVDYNIGFLVNNQTKTIDLAPNFDFGCAFDYSKFDDDYLTDALSQLNADELEQLIVKLRALFKENSDGIPMIANMFVGIHHDKKCDEIIFKTFNDLKNRVSQIVKCFENIKYKG